MTDPDFPEHLRAFIQQNIANVDAAEVLLFLAGAPDRWLTPLELAAELRPAALDESAARRYLAFFESRGLARQSGDRYQYRRVSPETEATIEALVKAYNERPVTLVRMIYTLKDEKIRSFADAFRLKKKDS
jgi:hypothetical protein